MSITNLYSLPLDKIAKEAKKKNLATLLVFHSGIFKTADFYSCEWVTNILFLFFLVEIP